MKCPYPYCNATDDDCVPDVVYRNAECYGGSVVRFKCLSCGCVIKAFSVVNVSIHNAEMTVEEPDW